MTSETRMWYGSSVVRQGRDRPWRAYHWSRFARKRRRAAEDGKPSRSSAGPFRRGAGAVRRGRGLGATGRLDVIGGETITYRRRWAAANADVQRSAPR